jgi:hypothetical protein
MGIKKVKKLSHISGVDFKPALAWDGFVDFKRELKTPLLPRTVPIRLFVIGERLT